MVKQIRRKPQYECSVCHNLYQTKAKAEECEKSKPKKIKLRVQNHDEPWKIGDTLWIHKHDYGHTIVRIVGEEKGYHKVWPVFEFLDTGEHKVFNDWDDGIIAIKGVQERILQWAETIKQNLTVPQSDMNKEEK